MTAPTTERSKEMEITYEFATRDDCLDAMVPSDLRKVVAERDEAKEEAARLLEETVFLRRILGVLRNLFEALPEQNMENFDRGLAEQHDAAIVEAWKIVSKLESPRCSDQSIRRNVDGANK